MTAGCDTRLVEYTVDADTGLFRWSPRPLPSPPTSIVSVLAPVVSADPDRPALIDGTRCWTYAELDGAVELMARRLAGAGLAEGGRLVWSTANCAELVIAFLASQRLGAVWVGLSPKLAQADEARLLGRIEPQVAIFGLEALAELPDDGPESSTAVDVLAPAAIGLTSGSAGDPKLVVHSQHGMLVPAHVSGAVEPPGDSERIGTPLPMTTLNLLVLGPLSAFVRGSVAVVMQRTDAPGFAADVERHAVTRALVVPTILHDVAVDDDIAPVALASLQRVIAGAATGRPEVFRRFRERFGVRPTASYGLTEAPTGVVRESFDDPIGSGRGFPLPHVDVIIDQDEIVLRPARGGRWADVWTPMLGYWGDPAATRAALSGGVLRTGDRGSVDADGGLSVAGRMGEMINRGGELISPEVVREALENRPEIAEAAVAALPDTRLGEAVGAVIVLTPGSTLPDLSTSMPRRHVPSTIRLSDALPRLPSGKVDLTEVRRLLAG